MTEFYINQAGLAVPIPKLGPPKPQPTVKERDGFPVKEGWTFSKCKDASNSQDESFRMRALENLYTAIDPGGGGIRLPGHVDNKKHLTKLLDEIAVALVGGVPQDWEVFT